MCGSIWSWLKPPEDTVISPRLQGRFRLLLWCSAGGFYIRDSIICILVFFNCLAPALEPTLSFSYITQLLCPHLPSPSSCFSSPRFVRLCLSLWRCTKRRRLCLSGGHVYCKIKTSTNRYQVHFQMVFIIIIIVGGTLAADTSLQNLFKMCFQVRICQIPKSPGLV